VSQKFLALLVSPVADEPKCLLFYSDGVYSYIEKFDNLLVTATILPKSPKYIIYFVVAISLILVIEFPRNVSK
jgi:hypothetical protein